MSTKGNTRNSSVAAQQKPGNELHLAKLTNAQLHKEMLEVRNDFFSRCVETQAYAADRLLPVCAAIIQSYRMQGVAPKDRPNGKPTVEAYCRSINLNYSTVRSWLHRKRLQTEMFETHKPGGRNGGDKVPHLTLLEARLLGTASAGHDLVKAIRQGGNVGEAVREFEDHAPTCERIEEYIERPMTVAGVTEVEKLAIRLCKLIDRNDGKHGQKILALARELLAKVESSVRQVLAQENKRQQREASKKMPPQPEKTMVPPPQPTNGVERRAQ
jgi:hypothetical protein